MNTINIDELWQDIESAGWNSQAVALYRDNHGHDYTPLEDWKDWIDQFEESYEGYYPNTSIFATEQAENLFTKDTPQHFVIYFDYDKFERDLFLGDYWESEGHIFRSI